MFTDKTTTFLFEALKIGRYLRPGIDVGPAMIAIIITAKGQVLYRPIYSFRTQEGCNIVPMKIRLAGILWRLTLEDGRQYHSSYTLQYDHNEDHE